MERSDARVSSTNGVIWLLFGLASLLATAPVWRLWVFGFNPTLDQLLQLSICGGTIQ
jgi:hypothetical protein